MFDGSGMGEGEGSAISERLYEEPRAHALRERYLALFGGPEVPVPVESIAEDFLGLRIEQAYMECSGMLRPAERLIRINAAEGPRLCRFAGLSLKPSDGLEPSTPSLPSRVAGERMRSAAPACKGSWGFRGLGLCSHLRAFASALLHKCSIAGVC
jgi:hypothetical protein